MVIMPVGCGVAVPEPGSRRWPRLPLEPLLVLLVRAGCRDRGEMAVRLGVDRRTILRAVSAGGLGEVAADRWACAAGYHPAEVWGADWWALCGAESVQGADDAAGV